MSGGSWDYFYMGVKDVASRLMESDAPERVAFGQHLNDVADALHAIEWVDSCDWGPGRDSEAIRKVLGPALDTRSECAAKDSIRKIRDTLTVLLEDG